MEVSGTGRVVRGYVDWIGARGHRATLADVVRRTGNDPHAIFDAMYREMPLVGFGRLGKSTSSRCSADTVSHPSRPGPRTSPAPRGLPQGPGSSSTARAMGRLRAPVSS